MKTIHNLLLLLCVAIAATLGACSDKGDDILKSIPAESSFIVKLNADEILKSAGCDRESGKYVLGKTLEDLASGMTSAERLKLDEVLAAMPAVDSENIYFYLYHNTPFLTCELKHADMLVAAMEKELGSPEQQDGYKVFEHMIFIRGNRLWVANDLEKLTEALEEAGKTPASEVAPYAKTFDSNHAASIAMNYNSLLRGNPYLAYSALSFGDFGKYFFAYHIDFDKNRMIADGCALDPDGNAISFADKVSAFDTRIAGFLPENPILALGTGKIDGALFEQALANTNDMVRNNVMPYLTAINGSIAMAIAPPTRFADLLKPNEWTFTACVGYESGKAGEVLRSVLDLGAQGLDIKELPDQLCVTVPGGLGAYNPAEFYIGYINGTLVASNKRITSTHSGEVGKRFDGFYYAGIFDLPADGDIVKGFGAPFGIKVNATCTDAVMHSEFLLEGSELPFIESIIQAATDNSFHRRAVEAFNNLQQ